MCPNCRSGRIRHSGMGHRLYRNGNPQKQQRGLYFKAAFEDALSRVYLEGGEKGKRTRFINVYP